MQKKLLRNKTFILKEQKVFIQNNSQLGLGAFSKVFYALNLHNLQEYAIKRIDQKKYFHLAQNEIVMYSVHLDGLSCVPKLFFVLKDSKYVYLFLENIKGVDLDVYLRCQNHLLTEIEAFFLFQQMVQVVYQIHQKGISHRDIKLENFMFNPKKPFNLYLIDFGFSDHLNKNDSHSYGTLAYAAPELFLDQFIFNEKVDTWALGVCLYTLSVGNYPFDLSQQDEIQLSDSEKSKKVAMNIKNLHIFNYKKNTKFLSEELKSLLFDSLLIRDATKRFNCNQILLSKWFQKMSKQIQKYGLTFAKLRALRKFHQP